MLFAMLVSACQFNEALLYVEPSPSGEAIPMVRPAAETAPVVSKEDAADDAVVLVAANGKAAWIAGADKKFGLRMYTLEGDEVSNFSVGRINNIDAVRLGADRYLLAASNRTSKAIELFSVTLAGGEPEVQIEPSIALTLEEPYGLCMAAFDDGVRVFVGDKDGRVEQWRVDADLNGTLERNFAFDSQTEGCVVDSRAGALYVGEETLGIWAVDLDSGTRRLVDRVGDGRLVADVEGLDIYRAASGETRYLLASSQGNNAYAVYALPSVTPLAQFRIGPNDESGVDGASETDGIALSSAALPDYPRGILVAQDGHNVSPPENQNFKIVDWREIEKLLLLR
ncbi:MAG: phytase [Pseudomonadota bacterium]